jgi:hypothetical protein
MAPIGFARRQDRVCVVLYIYAVAPPPLARFDAGLHNVQDSAIFPDGRSAVVRGLRVAGDGDERGAGLAQIPGNRFAYPFSIHTVGSADRADLDSALAGRRPPRCTDCTDLASARSKGARGAA